MALIYYKNPQKTFSQLTYKDFGAAAAYHTHEANDIRLIDHNGEDVPQIFSYSQGGTSTNTFNNNYKSAKILAGSSYNSNFQLSQISANNGVFGYFHGINNLPSFETWPVIAGGTGCTSQKDAMCNFNICITNTNQEQYINLDYNHIINAFLTNEEKHVRFSIILPYQLLPGTTGKLKLYPRVISQVGTTTASAYVDTKYTYQYGTSTPTTTPAIEGFTANFTAGTVQTTNNCIYQYGYVDKNNGTPTSARGYGGQASVTARGDVTIWANAGGLLNNNDTTSNNKTCYYVGNILTVEMDFSKTVTAENSTWPFTNAHNNRPILLALNQGLKTWTNQVIINAT